MWRYHVFTGITTQRTHPDIACHYLTDILSDMAIVRRRAQQTHFQGGSGTELKLHLHL